MRALNERNKTFNVHTDTHVGRKKRLAEAKARYVFWLSSVPFVVFPVS